MDMSKLDEALEAESVLFRQTVQAAVNEARIRRADMKTIAAKAMGLNLNQEMSEKDFFVIIEVFNKISGNLDFVLGQAGFSSESRRAWINKVTAPDVRFRLPIVQLLLVAVVDYYADTRLAYDLQAFLEEWGHPGSGPKTPTDRSVLLSKYLDEINGWSWGSMSVRAINAIKNEDIRTVGELVSRSEADILRTPNLGRKSLNEIKAFLKGIGLSLGSLNGAEKEQVKVRRLLNENAGKPLTTEWCVGIKPAYKELQSHERLRKWHDKEDPYVWEKADPDLILALNVAGITERTELATAPKDVLETICSGHDGWNAQVVNLFKDPRPRDGHWQQAFTLGLHLQVPPHLSEDVKVYREK